MRRPGPKSVQAALRTSPIPVEPQYQLHKELLMGALERQYEYGNGF